ncbi:MAG TPA: hypothetical protein VGH72_18665, partial [Pseudonocardia sp.]
STGTGTCQGAVGGCQAVTNSGASAGPDASKIAPLVNAPSTTNATTTSDSIGNQATQSGQGATQACQGGSGSNGGGTGTGSGGQQPATPPAPAGSPGAGANVAPTVPGASSWSNATATLNCQAGAGGCTGTVHSTAVGSDGPKTANGATGSRGPPAGQASTSGSCTSQADAQGGCQAVSNSTSGSGQVVADTMALTNQNAATQAKQQAQQAQQTADQAKQTADAPGATTAQRKAATDAAATAKQADQAATAAAKTAAAPVTNAPPTLSQSQATAQCVTTGCTATTSGDTSGFPGASHTDATCTAGQGGCAVTSDATVTLMRDSGQRTAGDKKNPAGDPIPGSSGSAETGSNAVCPDAGCTVKVTGNVTASVEQGGRHSTSTGDGNTACAGSGPCQAGIRVTTNTAVTAPGVKSQSAATSANVSVSCDNGTDAGCPIHAASQSDVVGSKDVHAKTTATCAGGTGCLVGTGGTASPDLAQVSYQCGGAGGCTGHSEGNARGGAASGNANSDCTAGKNGQCAGTTLVGASSDDSAMAGASCQGTEDAKCHYHFEGTASDSSRSGASWAKAYAHGSQDGEMGGGVVQVMAKTQASAADAQAQASCTGAKNCTSPYSAHAEAHDRSTQMANAKQPDMPSGVWKANGSGTCSGNGKGGCGVHAWAQAGPGGSGGAACTGDCSHFKEEQSGNGFTQTGPSWNQILAAQAAARAAQAARQVQDIDQWAKNAKPGDSVLGYKKNP